MGDLNELKDLVERLLRTTSEDGAFLVVTVAGTEDFMQLIGDASGVQLDFPLLTGRQLSFEWAFKAVAQGEALTVLDIKDGDSRFLRIDLAANAPEVYRLLRVFLQDVFRVTDSTNLEFELEGVE